MTVASESYTFLDGARWIKAGEWGALTLRCRAADRLLPTDKNSSASWRAWAILLVPQCCQTRGYRWAKRLTGSYGLWGP